MYNLTYRVFDGVEEDKTHVIISLRPNNRAPPGFERLLYSANTVPEVIDNLPFRLATVSFLLFQFTFCWCDNH